MLRAYLAWDTDTAASVGNAGGKVVDIGSFVESRQAALVVFTLLRVIGFNMSAMLLGHLLYGVFNYSTKHKRINILLSC